MRILVTGSEGLIGKALVKELEKKGIQTQKYDTSLPFRHPNQGNILDIKKLQAYANGCDGIVHLAAVSRVIWGEENPELCWQTNFIGTHNVIRVALSEKCSWVLYASSREVYGNQEVLPVKEDSSLAPVNIYGRSKMAAERLMFDVRSHNLNTAIVRYSNVYGSSTDHPDRVIPAFCQAAALGKPLRVEGSNNTFDFTHITDVVNGTLRIIEKLIKGEQNLPPFHLTTGRQTSLREAANIANTAAGNLSKIIEAPSRTFDVSNFCGDATKTMSFLNWKPLISIEEGMKQLVYLFKDQLGLDKNLSVSHKRASL